MGDSNPSRNLTAEQMKKALSCLDKLLPKPVELIVGGGGAMILAHKFPLSTTDIDAIPRGLEFHKFDLLVKQVGRELGIAPDWLNTWYANFASNLPADFASRLIKVFSGRKLTAQALGATDLLVMKCFAHREKDVGHAKALIKVGADVEFVKNHIESLDAKGIPNAEDAMTFLEDILDQI